MKARRITEAEAPPAPFPDWKVELLGKSGPLGTLEIGRVPSSGSNEGGADSVPLVPVRSSFRPGIILEVPADQLREIPKQRSDLVGTHP